MEELCYAVLISTVIALLLFLLLLYRRWIQRKDDLAERLAEIQRRGRDLDRQLADLLNERRVYPESLSPTEFALSLRPLDTTDKHRFDSEGKFTDMSDKIQYVPGGHTYFDEQTKQWVALSYTRLLGRYSTCEEAKKVIEDNKNKVNAAYENFTGGD